MRDKLPKKAYDDLMAYAIQCGKAEVLVEKAVDVHLAIDMLGVSDDNKYEVGLSTVGGRR